MSSHDEATFYAVLRTDFSALLAKVFETVNPGQAYLHNWHLDAIAWELGQCLVGKTQNLIITMPPRYLKSIAVSVALPAFILGHDPTARIICASYSGDLAGKHSRDCRKVMESGWYKRVFPATRLSPDKNTEFEFETTKQGFRMAVSVGGPLTGRGGNVMIIDDSIKPGDAVSDILRQKVNDWYDQTAVTRMDDKRTGVKIIVQQRVHQNDLVGNLLAKTAAHWRHLSLSAIAKEDGHIQVGPSQFHERREGDILHPEREPREKLDELRAEMGSATFLAQYQQDPVPPGGNMVDPRWFVRLAHNEFPEGFEHVVQSWDTAIKTTELADYSVCITFGLKGKNIYIAHVHRERLVYPDLKRKAKYLAHLFNPHSIIIEDKSSGQQLLQELKEEQIPGLKPYVPKGDKRMRMNGQTGKIEAGQVFVPAAATWLNDFLDELASFPQGKYDDQADALSQGLDWIQSFTLVPSFLQFYKSEAERLRRAPNSPSLS